MADQEAQSKPAPEAGGEEIQSKVTPAEVTGGDDDAVDGSLIASGEVSYNGKSHQLLLMQKGLRLLATSQAGSGAGADAASVPVLDVPWREVMCACEPPVKKSKSSSIPKAKKTEGGGGDAAGPSKAFVVHYMVRNAKTFKLQCRSVALEVTQEAAEGWILQIEEKRKEGKPQKLLVIINPIGGKGNARQLLKTRVQPLFTLAGVELVVKVTERAQQAIEIAKTFDVASVDGVIVMGGDGLYMEVLHGLTVRKQEEEGVDYNNPDTTLVPPTVRVGIIPSGTGNGASAWFNGVLDIDTATLNIIRGLTARANILAIHEGPKLIQFSGVLIANGFFSSLIKRTEELRWMKTMRYPYVLLSQVMGKKKVLEFDIEILKNEQAQSDKDEGAKAEGAKAECAKAEDAKAEDAKAECAKAEDAKAEDAKAECAEAAKASASWTKLGSKELTATMCFPAIIEDNTDDDMMVINPFSPGFDLMLLSNSASAMDNLRFIFTFFTRKKSGLERPYIDWVRNILGARFHVKQPTAEGAASSSQQTEITELCKILDVDGECISLSEPKYEIRLHRQFLQVFSYPEYLTKEPPPS